MYIVLGLVCRTSLCSWGVRSSRRGLVVCMRELRLRWLRFLLISKKSSLGRSCRDILLGPGWWCGGGWCFETRSVGRSFIKE